MQYCKSSLADSLAVLNSKQNLSVQSSVMPLDAYPTNLKNLLSIPAHGYS